MNFPNYVPAVWVIHSIGRSFLGSSSEEYRLVYQRMSIYSVTVSLAEHLGNPQAGSVILRTGVVVDEGGFGWGQGGEINRKHWGMLWTKRNETIFDRSNN